MLMDGWEGAGCVKVPAVQCEGLILKPSVWRTWVEPGVAAHL